MRDRGRCYSRTSRSSPSFTACPTSQRISLTVPAFFGSAFYIFLLRQFFLTIPPDFEDAAIAVR